MAKLNKDQLQKAHNKLKDTARQRVAERGILQFRADSELVLAVMDAADQEAIPVGTLLRKWVQEKLQLESARDHAPDLMERVLILEQTVSKLKQKLK
ncbi:MAG: hypothetical protein IPG59_09250 [Candidatus Melainabacteria bacterium]|nr:MAG: hypothetical protein IPG59_09250 [Candidatus Melainabacteria bacterium]